ncbi:hypothetical protein SAMN05216349_11463 [Oribacterium sp. KHPX15]|uniref:hypothetical protein n=1 Tax=Oribacterium sp. KHPX15 TaxID=1855342 RepID=UPI0008995955|nr:hypothetical protein [Oribacterium sp. KHPX15]SEA49776.1 hypothetical protein SAMN05216349_11463 [Oribacterium sp. KHPX15]
MTGFGMTIMFFGMGCICIGWSNSPKNAKLLGMGGIMMLGGMFIGIGANPAKDMPNGSPEMVVLGFLLSAIGVVMMVLQLGAAKKSNQARADKMAEDKKIAFYNECVNNGIKECKSEKEIQKCTLIAQKHKIQYSNVSILFYEAKASVDKDIENRKEAALNAKKDEERIEYNELNKYSGFKGRDKRIAILSAERTAALESAKTLRNGAQAIMGASQQKEHDWAIHGGIASGIAGPAAGLAAAADIQAKNAQIRAQNEANAKAFAPLMMTSLSGAADYDRHARALQEEIEAAKIKLVSNDDAKTCLSKITFSDTKVEVSETGTCTVTTSAKLATPMIIFDDVDAIIDGTIIANIYEGKTLVGVASLVLPKYGIKGETKLKGMCLFCGTKGKTYTVEYAATNLWAMER